MFRKIVRTTVEAACRALLEVEKVMVRWMAPELTPWEAEKYRGIIERHERELYRKGGGGI